jgi:hypothetical protein
MFVFGLVSLCAAYITVIPAVLRRSMRMYIYVCYPYIDATSALGYDYRQSRSLNKSLSI